MKLNDFYAAAGGDLQDVRDRLRSDALIVKILKMLPRDNSCELLLAAVREGDATTAFRAVHTLKGTALNLSLNGLAAACEPMTELLRGRDELPDGAEPLALAVSREYERAVDALKLLDA